MKTCFRKEYCHKCGKSFDPALGKCPNCGTQSVAFEDVKGMANLTPMGWGKELALFLTGWLGFQLIGTLISLIVLSVTKGAYVSAGLSGASLTAAMKAFEGSVTYAGAVDFSAYVILFCLMLIILDRDLYRLTKLFKKGKSYFGILAGVGMVFLSAIYGMIIQATGLKGTNDNQSIINQLVAESPILSVLVFSFLGPFCEELAYRVGLFGLGKRINTYVAYIAASLIFGFIHMNFRNLGSALEWAYLPDYVISGFLFCLLYDKLGFGASYAAHVTNNFIGIMGIIITLNSGK